MEPRVLWILELDLAIHQSLNRPEQSLPIHYPKVLHAICKDGNFGRLQLGSTARLEGFEDLGQGAEDLGQDAIGVETK